MSVANSRRTLVSHSDHTTIQQCSHDTSDETFDESGKDADIDFDEEWPQQKQGDCKQDSEYEREPEAMLLPRRRPWRVKRDQADSKTKPVKQGNDHDEWNSSYRRIVLSDV